MLQRTPTRALLAQLLAIGAAAGGLQEQNCSARALAACPSDALMALVPDSAGRLADTAYGAGGAFLLDLPGVSQLQDKLASLASLGRANGSAIAGIGGCGNHPGLDNGSDYCYIQVDVGGIAGLMNETEDWVSQSGDKARRLGLLQNICVVFHLAQRRFSLSMEPGFAVSAGPASFSFSGVAVSGGGCSQLPLQTYWAGDDDLVADQEMKFQLSFSGKVSVGVEEPDLHFAVAVTATGMLAGNLDLAGRGISNSTSSNALIASLLRLGSLVGGAEWAVVLQTRMAPRVTVGPLTLNALVVEGQIYAGRSGNETPGIYLSFTVKHATSLQDLFSGVDGLRRICAASGSRGLPQAIADSPLCSAPSTQDSQVQLYAYANKDGAGVRLRAWGAGLSLQVTPLGLRLCAGTACWEGCAFDSSCRGGHQCCQSTLSFQCAPIRWAVASSQDRNPKAPVKVDQLSCLEALSCEDDTCFDSPGDIGGEGADCAKTQKHCQDGFQCCGDAFSDSYRCELVLYQRVAILGLTPCGCGAATERGCFVRNESALGSIYASAGHAITGLDQLAAVLVAASAILGGRR